MKVSIIIPVYNVSDYVERCINSVINQTYTDLECIIVDDCTPDDSIEKCEKLIAEYNGPICFKILHHEKNRGLSAARNTGTNAATGDWVFYLDSDDELTHDAILLLIQDGCKYDNMEMVIGNVISFPHDDYYDLKIPQSPYSILNNNKAVRLSLLYPKPILPVMAWNKLIRLDFIKNNHLYFKEQLIHEDEHWIFFVIKKMKSITFISDRTYIHYETPNSIMTSSSITKRAECFIKIIYAYLQNIDSSLSDLQLLKALNLYFTFFNSANENITKRKVRFLMIYHLLSHHLYKIAFHFIIHKYRNRSVQKLKYNLIPELNQKMAIKYKHSFYLEHSIN